MELCLVYRLEGQRFIEVWRLEQEHREIQGVRGSLQMSRGGGGVQQNGVRRVENKNSVQIDCTNLDQNF